jgi:hypothetical protein
VLLNTGLLNTGLLNKGLLNTGLLNTGLLNKGLLRPGTVSAQVGAGRLCPSRPAPPPVDHAHSRHLPVSHP